MANRKSRTISTSEDTESPFLRSPKKKQYGIFERDHVGKSFVLIILGAFAGARSISAFKCCFFSRIASPFGNKGSI